MAYKKKLKMAALCFVILFAASTLYSRDVALRDLKNLYLDYQIKVPNPYWQMKDDVRRQYRDEFADKLRSIGFTIVDTADKADAVILCSFQNAEKQLKWVALDRVTAQFSLPNSDFVIASYDVGNKEWADGNVTVKQAEDKIIAKIREDYDSGDKKYRVGDDGNAVKIDKPFLPVKDGKVALKDFRNVYIEFVTDSITNLGRYMDEKAKSEYVKTLHDEAARMGFSVVTDPRKANVKMVFHAEGLAYATGFGWVVDKLWAEFLLPETDFFIERFQAAKPYLATLKSMTKDLLEKIEEERSSGTNTYTTRSTAVLNKIKDSVVVSPGLIRKTIFKDRPGVEVVKDAVYTDLGILIMPIWGEGQLLGMGSPLSFAGWFEKPGLNDSFRDIKERDKDRKVGGERKYLMSEISEDGFPPIIFREKGSTAYFRDDLRDIIFTAFANALDQYKVNFKEVRFEDYRQEILADGLEGALAKIRADHGGLERIFVVYYIPFANWIDVRVAGNYTYYSQRNGLFLFIFASYFDLSGKVKSLMNFKAEVEQFEPMIVTVSYNIAEEAMEAKIKTALQKKESSSALKEFSKDNLRDDVGYVKRKNAVLRSADGTAVATLDQLSLITVLGKDSGKALVEVTAYVDADKIEIKSPTTIIPRGSETILRRNIIFENLYGRSTINGNMEILGRFSGTAPIELARPLKTSPLSKRYNQIAVKGYLSDDDISADKGFTTTSGVIRGQVLRNGAPAANAKLYIRPVSKKESVTTDSMGYFEFKDIVPGYGYSIFFVKDKNDEHYRYRIKNAEKKIRIDPGEVLDLGGISADDVNLYDTTATIERVKGLIKVMKPGVSTKANAIVNFGQPTTKYTDDIWGFKNYDKLEIIAYFEGDKVKNMGFVSEQE